MSNTAITRLWALAALLWVSALFLAPFVASTPSPGSFAYLVSLAIYKAGSLVCHQQPERSFHLWGAQLPVCARCTGIYLGALGSVLVALTVRRPRFADPLLSRAMVALVVAATPALLTLLFEWTTGVMPGNWTRASSGIPLGAMVAWLIVAASAPREALGIH